MNVSSDTTVGGLAVAVRSRSQSHLSHGLAIPHGSRRGSKPPKRSLSRVIKNMPKGPQSQAEGFSMVESIQALAHRQSLPSSSGLLQRSVGRSRIQSPEEDEVMPNPSSLT